MAACFGVLDVRQPDIHRALIKFPVLKGAKTEVLEIDTSVSPAKKNIYKTHSDKKKIEKKNPTTNAFLQICIKN